MNGSPFDAFSILVRFTEPVTGFVAAVTPAEHAEAILLYGRDELVPQSRVLLDEDATVAFDVPEPSRAALHAAGCLVISLFGHLRRRARKRGT